MDVINIMLVDQLHDLVSQCEEDLEIAHRKLNKINSTPDKSTDELVSVENSIANLKSLSKQILQYTYKINKSNVLVTDNTKRLQVEKQVLQKYLEEAKQDNMDLKKKIINMESIISKQMVDIQNIVADRDKQLNKYELLQKQHSENSIMIADKDIDRLVEAYTDLLGMLEDNIKVIATSEKIRRKPSGREYDKGKKAAIIEAYEDGMTPTQLHNKLKADNIRVSLPTVIKRMRLEGWFE